MSLRLTHIEVKNVIILLTKANSTVTKANSTVVPKENFPILFNILNQHQGRVFSCHHHI